MNKDKQARPPAAPGLVPDPLKLAGDAVAYATDAWQRGVLYTDIRRQRGDQYRAHLEEQVPNVLSFPAEPVMLGKDLPRPVNYGLVRILPDAATPTEPSVFTRASFAARGVSIGCSEKPKLPTNAVPCASTTMSLARPVATAQTSPALIQRTGWTLRLASTSRVPFAM